jgi:hypothetical protein
MDSTGRNNFLLVDAILAITRFISVNQSTFSGIFVGGTSVAAMVLGKIRICLAKVGVVMAEFKILTHPNGTPLRLKLVGTFDAVSGSQLIGLLRK